MYTPLNNLPPQNAEELDERMSAAYDAIYLHYSQFDMTGGQDPTYILLQGLEAIAASLQAGDNYNTTLN